MDRAPRSAIILAGIFVAFVLGLSATWWWSGGGGAAGPGSASESTSDTVVKQVTQTPGLPGGMQPIDLRNLPTAEWVFPPVDRGGAATVVLETPDPNDPDPGPYPAPPSASKDYRHYTSYAIETADQAIARALERFPAESDGVTAAARLMTTISSESFQAGETFTAKSALDDDPVWLVRVRIKRTKETEYAGVGESADSADEQVVWLVGVDASTGMVYSWQAASKEDIEAFELLEDENLEIRFATPWIFEGTPAPTMTPTR